MIEDRARRVLGGRARPRAAAQGYDGMGTHVWGFEYRRGLAGQRDRWAVRTDA
jgi:hypothetical protein